MGEAIYGRAFFDAQGEGSLRSARTVVPLLLELVQPLSVLDVGCGRGAWLRAFQEQGIDHVWGVDGHYVERDTLLIPPKHFTPVDLRHPEQITGHYDLAVCLEVGEHLPDSVAPRLVQALTARAPLVLFSAALPGQTGTAHTNEQWPEYWDALFGECAYRALDLLRPRLYAETRVEWWYRQNLMLYASAQALARWPALAAASGRVAGPRLEWVHVDMLRWTLQRYGSTRFLARELSSALWRKLRGR